MVKDNLANITYSNRKFGSIVEVRHQTSFAVFIPKCRIRTKDFRVTVKFIFYLNSCNIASPCSAKSDVCT